MQQGEIGGEPGGVAGRIIARLLAGVLVAGLLMLFLRDWQRIQQSGPTVLKLQAFLPENGGWVSEPLRVDSGRSAVIDVQTVEGVHAFAVAHTDVRSPIMTPGSRESISLTAPAPGKYVLYCTVWCSPDHWRMRTVIEVIDPIVPEAPVGYVVDEPWYAIPVETLPLDEPHPALFWPMQRPKAQRGEEDWRRLSPSAQPSDAAATPSWPLATPEQIFEQLSGERDEGFMDASSLSDQEKWDLVGYLWRQRTTDQSLALGAALYRENCAACHGEAGQGDGFSAGSTPAAEPDLSDPANAFGASPALYYAKIGRGGMGTGMPNWGTIFGEEEMWALVDYLYSLAFDYSTIGETEK